MVPIDTRDKPLDPVELVNGTIERAWDEICIAYDVTVQIPDMRDLFANANLSKPNRAAEIVIVNMLTEVIECVSRFSPWYKMPARAFGLISVRDQVTHRTCWTLAPEGAQRWQDILEPLTEAIRKYGGLIEAIILVDDLMLVSAQDSCLTARCGCIPPREIRIKQSILEQAEIVCDSCRQPFTG